MDVGAVNEVGCEGKGVVSEVVNASFGCRLLGKAEKNLEGGVGDPSRIVGCRSERT